jgi:nitronate monooxygenase
MDWSQSGRELKAWKDIWSAGQSVEAVQRVESTAEIVERLRREYREALSHPGFET